MLTWTLTTSSFLPTSSMQGIPTSRTMAISRAGLPSGASLSEVRTVTETPMWITGTSALFLHGWKHGFHDGYHHAEELLSLSRPPYQRKGQAVEKDKQAESLYPAFRQRASKMGANRKTERSEPVYKQSMLFWSIPWISSISLCFFFNPKSYWKSMRQPILLCYILLFNLLFFRYLSYLFSATISVGFWVKT